MLQVKVHAYTGLQPDLIICSDMELPSLAEETH